HGWNATEFSWFRYGQYNETGIYISIEKTIIITITVSGGCFKKEYSIVSHMLVTDTITEATLYENGLYTRHIRLSRPVSDSKYPLPPGSQLIKKYDLTTAPAGSAGRNIRDIISGKNEYRRK
ncbi:hypothetical protein ACJQTF_005168, partial [Escherichia coli]